MSFFEGMDYEQAARVLGEKIQQERTRCNNEHQDKMEALNAEINKADDTPPFMKKGPFFVMIKL